MNVELLELREFKVVLSWNTMNHPVLIVLVSVVIIEWTPTTFNRICCILNSVKRLKTAHVMYTYILYIYNKYVYNKYI